MLLVSQYNVNLFEGNRFLNGYFAVNINSVPAEMSEMFHYWKRYEETKKGDGQI